MLKDTLIKKEERHVSATRIKYLKIKKKKKKVKTRVERKKEEKESCNAISIERSDET